MWNLISIIIMLAPCVAAITFTISVTSIFEGLRNYLDKKSKFLGELIHCPWCLSFYVSCFFTFITSMIVFESSSYIINLYKFILIVFGVMAISGIIHYVLLRAYDPIRRANVERELKRLNGE